MGFIENLMKPKHVRDLEQAKIADAEISSKLEAFRETLKIKLEIEGKKDEITKISKDLLDPKKAYEEKKERLDDAMNRNVTKKKK